MCVDPAIVGQDESIKQVTHRGAWSVKPIDICDNGGNALAAKNRTLKLGPECEIGENKRNQF